MGMWKKGRCHCSKPSPVDDFVMRNLETGQSIHLFDANDFGQSYIMLRTPEANMVEAWKQLINPKPKRGFAYE